MKMLYAVKKQTNKHFNLSFTVSQLFTGMINGQHTDPPSSIPKVRVGVRVRVRLGLGLGNTGKYV